MKKEEVIEFKKVGFMKQLQKDMFSVRLRVPVGILTPKQLKRIAEASQKFGKGYVHITTRQSVEIPWVHEKDLQALKDFLAEGGVQPGSCGPRVRNILACPGSHICRYGILDAQEFGKAIDKKFFGRDLPRKIKIAVTGCPNSCAKPQENDIGLMGVVRVKIGNNCTGCSLCVEACRENAIEIKDKKAVIDYDKCIDCIDCLNVCPTNNIIEEKRGWAVFIGGNIGRHPRFGNEITRLVSDDEALKIIDRTIDAFIKNAKEGERFGASIERVGLDKYKKLILK